ncbi:MAG: hypothetical protein K2N63_01955, partial [Lachnospiraceae bacterium]|nr:hypothetical protein [Lachnospiraceae bacterium]
RVIAQVPKVHKKRVWVGLDRLFARMGGLALYERDAAALAKVAAQSVRAELTALGASDFGFGDVVPGSFTGEKLVFTGNAAQKEIEKLLSSMEWGNSCTVRCAPSILKDPSAVKTVMEADYVVLVEKQEGSTYSQIERELSELVAWKKKVLGFIVIDVDAVP